MLAVKTLSSWNSYVARKRVEGTVIDLESSLKDYILEARRGTVRELFDYVYGFTGEEYRSNQFDKYINNMLRRIGNEYNVVFANGCFEYKD